MQQLVRHLLSPLVTLLASFLFVQLHAQQQEIMITAGLETPVPILINTLSSMSRLFTRYLPSDLISSPINASEIARVLSQSPDWSVIGFALEDAVVVTFQCLKLWTTFFLLLAVPILQALAVFGETALPHVLMLVKIGADYVSKMEPFYQALLAFTMLFLLVCVRKGYVHEARVQYRYIGCRTSSTNLLSSDALFRLLSVGYPLLRSIRVIRQKRLYSKHTKSTPPSSRSKNTSKLITKFDNLTIPDFKWRPYEACLKYWVIWSLAVCLIGMVTLFLPTFVTSFFTVPLDWYNVFLVWMHSPFTRGDIALYSLLSPLISPYANRIHEREATINVEAEEKTNFLIRILVSFRVVPERHVHLAKDLWSQGPALFGLFFMFTPGFVASRGCLLMGFGFPAYVTIGVLSEKRTRRYEWWLAYFSVAVAADYFIAAIGREIGWLPLFYHVKLLMMMWLQFPYFQGAEQIFNAIFSSVFMVPACKEK
ncbi:unnamed protein product [Peronospora destructor]|uniref:Transmembrane protein n=1 Tax=Peronospora destructor TaxID=86335 RepID=A0AAV0VAU8_9STRA|nr:unnamed protein product [Peronospora destructor]